MFVQNVKEHRFSWNKCQLCQHVSTGPICHGFRILKASFLKFNLLHLCPPVGHHGMPKTSHSGLLCSSKIHLQLNTGPKLATSHQNFSEKKLDLTWCALYVAASEAANLAIAASCKKMKTSIISDRNTSLPTSLPFKMSKSAPAEESLQG